MNRSFFFRVLAVVAIVVVLVPIATALLLRFSDTRVWLINSLESVAGGKVEIGDIGVRWKPRPELVLEDFSISNPGWRGHQRVLEADNVWLALDLSSLLTGSVLVDQMRLESARLTVEFRDDRHNLRFRSPAESARPLVFPEFLQISTFLVDDSEVTITHNGNVHTVSIDSAEFFSESRHAEIEVDLSGAYQGEEMEVSGVTGSVNTVVNRIPSDVAVSGYIGNRTNRFAVSGTAADLVGWRGLDLQGRLEFTNMAFLHRLMDIRLPDIESVAANLRIVQPATVSSLSLESITGAARVAGLEIAVNGRVGEAVTLSGLEFETGISGQWMQEGWARHFTAPLTVNGEARVSGSVKELRVEIVDSALGLPGLTAGISGATTITGGVWERPLQLNAQVENYSFLAAAQSGALEAMPPLDLSGNITRDDSGYDLVGLDISTRDPESGGWLQAMGTVLDVGKSGAGTFRVTGQFDPHWIHALAGHPVAALLGQVKVEAKAQWQQGVLDLPSVALSASDSGGTLTVNGAARDLLTDRSVDVVVEGRGIDLERLAVGLGWKVSGLGGLDINAAVAGNRQEGYTLKDILARSSGHGLDANIRANGYLPGDFLGNESGFDMEIDMILESGDVFIPYVAAPGGLAFLSALVPIRVNTSIRGSGDQSGFQVDVEDFVMGSRAGGLDIGVIGVATDVLDPGSRSGSFDIAVTGHPDRLFDLADDVSGLRWLFDSGLHRGRLKGGARFAISGEEIGFTDIDLELQRNDVILTTRGNTGPQNPLALESVEVTLQTESLARLFPEQARKFNLEHPAHGVVKAESLSKNRAVSFNLKVVDSELSGSVHWNPSALAAGESSLEIELESNSLDLSIFDRPGEKGERLFSETPMKMDWLVENDFRISGRIQELDTRRFKLENASIQGVSKDNEFNLSILGRSKRDEVVTATLGVLPADNGYAVDASIKGFNVGLGALKHSTRWNENESSEFSLDMAITGEGQSLQEIMADSNGHIYLEVINARVHSRALTLVSRDLLLGVLREVNPLSGRRDHFDVECGVIHLDVTEGQAVTTNGIAIKTGEFALLGGGGVDFDSEAIEAVITSKARTGLGINTNTIANITRVGGTLVNPEIEANPSGFFKSGITIWAGILSGGLSLVAQGLIDRVTANSDVCDLAADREAPPSGSGQAEPEDSK